MARPFTELNNILRSLGPVLDFLRIMCLPDTQRDLGKVSKMEKKP